jgi:hypothetical protein
MIVHKNESPLMQRVLHGGRRFRSFPGNATRRGYLTAAGPLLEAAAMNQLAGVTV